MKYLKLFENTDNGYRTEPLEICFYYSGLTYTNMEVEEVTSEKIVINFNIDIEYKNWGIKGISIYNFNGPQEIQCEVAYYKSFVAKGGSITEEQNTVSINIPIDWSKATIDKQTGQGVIDVDSIVMDLANDDMGRIYVKEITITTNEL